MLGLRRALALAFLPILSGCAMHSTATQWNGHVGADGKPVFAFSSTYVGLHLVGLLPIAGNTRINDMIDESTRSILAEDGSRLPLDRNGDQQLLVGRAAADMALLAGHDQRHVRVQALGHCARQGRRDGA